jgi:hypothetical protein
MLTPFEPLTPHVANTDSPTRKPLIVLRILLGLSFAATILISWPMWLSSREFPLVPLLSFIPPLPGSFDLVPPVLLLVAITATLFIPSPIAAVSVIALTLGLWAQDQNRIHPWGFVFILFYATLANQWGSRTRNNCVGTLQFIVVAVYFWTGFQKLRISYFNGIAPLMTAAFVGETTSYLMGTLFWSAPLLEILCALLLLTRRFRRSGVLLAVLLHGVIISMLLVGGVNYSVIPWNVFMIGAVIILFWRSEIPWREILSPDRSITPCVVRIACGLLPALGYVGLWNSYLSFAVYAGASGAGYAFIDDSRGALPKIVPFHLSNPENPNFKEVTLDAWGYKVLRSMPSPEPRVLRVVGEELCRNYFSSGTEMVIFFTDPMLPWENTKPEQALACENGALVPANNPS